MLEGSILACFFSFAAVPGVMFVVSQNIIQYAQLSESSLAQFFSFFESENVRDALDANQLSHSIMGLWIFKLCMSKHNVLFVINRCGLSFSQE